MTKKIDGEGIILVVEDEPDMRELVVAQVGHMGFEVHSAKDGVSALHSLKSEPHIDLLLTDVILPGNMSGPDIAREARLIHPRIKLLFMSGYPKDAFAGHMMMEENVLLHKPFRKTVLAEQIFQALEPTN